MENINDLKEDSLDDIHEVLTKLSGSERRAHSKQVIYDAAFLGTKTQTPVDSIPEAIGILKAVIWKYYDGCEVRGDLKTFSVS